MLGRRRREAVERGAARSSVPGGGRADKNSVQRANVPREDVDAARKLDRPSSRA
jgi:hypothetical protein